MTSALCKMPVSTIKVKLPEKWGRFTFEDIKKAWLLGTSLWTNEVKLEFDVQRQPDTVHIAPAWGYIDGPGSVLAWSRFPCPWRPPIAQRYDSSENYSLTMPGKGSISLPILIAHEVGHALGIGHGPRGNLMAPYINNALTRLGSFDLREIRARYPKRVAQTQEAGEVPKFFQCVLAALPTILTCLFSKQQEAEAAQQRGPLDELTEFIGKLTSNGS